MIEIKVSGNTDRFIKKCLENEIDLLNISYFNDYILVSIKEKDLKRIKKLNYYSKITLNRYLGKKNIIFKLKKNIYNILLLFVFIILIYLVSNIIVFVEVKHENKDMIKKINELLVEKGIKPLSIKKTNKELNRISDEITSEHRDFIDFLSITRTGMKYKVNLEERIIKKETLAKERCHIIAKKDGVVTDIFATKGIINKEKGNLVKKGDILISGEIILNEEIKGNVCAEGSVLANTWYKIDISYPLKETIKTYTKREKINIKKYNKYIKKRVYDEYDERVLLKFGTLSLVKQKEYKSEEVNITKNDATKKAIEEGIRKLKEKLGEIEIIDKKVLNSRINNSKIELEIFISVNENIGETQEYEGREQIDSSESLQHTN